MHIGAGFLQSDPLNPDRRFLFADEKINTVIVVVLVVLAGLATYLLLSGRKVGKLEKQLAELEARQPKAEQQTEVESIEVKKVEYHGRK